MSKKGWNGMKTIRFLKFFFVLYLFFCSCVYSSNNSTPVDIYSLLHEIELVKKSQKDFGVIVNKLIEENKDIKNNAKRLFEKYLDLKAALDKNKVLGEKKSSKRKNEEHETYSHKKFKTITSPETPKNTSRT